MTSYFVSLFKSFSFWLPCLFIGGLGLTQYYFDLALPSIIFYPLMTLLIAFLLCRLLSPLSFFQKVFGELNWSKPSWANKAAIKSMLKNNDQKSKKKLLAGLGSLLLVGGVSLWWFTREVPPPPPTSLVTLHQPSATYFYMNDGKREESIYPLQISFSRSVAPLKNIGKEIKDKIDLSPNIKGVWKWTSDKNLSFMPEKTWEPGREFSVSFAKGLTSEVYTLDKTEFEFKIAPLAIESSKGEFYEDPRDPTKRKAIFTIRFNYPVNPEDVEGYLQMSEVEYGKKKNEISTAKIGFKVSFDKVHYTAYIHSDQIKIPEYEGQIKLKIKEGLKGIINGEGLVNTSTLNVRVPGMFNYFNVQSSSLNIVDNKKGVPEHIGVLTFSTGVVDKNVKKSLEIYELPFKNHKTKRVINWRRNQHVIQKMDMNKLTKVPFEMLPSAETYPKTHSFKVLPTVGRYYLIRVKKGLQSASQFVMGDKTDLVVYADHYPRKVKLLHEGAILSLKGEKKLHLYSINVKDIEVRIGQVLEQQVQHLLSQTSGDFKNLSFRNNYQFNEKNLAHFEKYDLKVTDYSSTKPSYNTIDFGKYLDRKVQGRAAKGIFFVEVVSKKNSVRDKRLILVSDLGVMVKKGVSQNNDIFVQSLRTGAAVEGAKIQIIGSNGLSLATQTTGPRGHVAFPALDTRDSFKPRPIGILVKKGTDLAYMKYNDYNRQLSFSKFDIGGKPNARGKDAISAFLFSDRGIYRPGENGKIGYIAKSGAWGQSLAGIPIDIEIDNARGKTILREAKVLRKNGLGDIEFDLSRNAPTGSYSAKIYNFFGNNRKKSRRLIGSVNFKVEEFMPDRLKLKVFLNKQKTKGWVKPEDLSAELNLQNLFGYPAEGHRVQVKMKIDPLSLYFSDFKDYRFDNPSDYFRSYSEVIADKTTDDKGLAQYEINVDKFASNIFRLKIFAEGFEKESGRSVTAQTSTLVSPHPYLVGVKAVGDFNYIKAKEEKDIEFVAIDNNVKSITADDLYFTTYKYKYVNVLTKRPNGSYGYESVLKEEILEKKDFSITEGGVKVSLDTSTAGQFKIEISTKAGVKLSKMEYSIIGKQNLARSLGKNAELKVKLNKKDFLPGENIELEIKAPYKGAGLITIERDKVYSYKWFKQDQETTVQKIKLPADLEGNAYVNVNILRSFDSKEIYTSPLSYGVFPFTINKDAKDEKIELDVVSVAKPGKDLQISYKTSKNSEIILYAINEGILQFANYKNPKPLDYFFAKRSLETTTYQLLDLILPEYSIVRDQLAPGGGQGSFSEHMNPFNRKLKKPVAYWSGILKSSPLKQTWSIPIPGHFNGGLRILAVAVGKSSIGSEARKMFVRADLILTPNVLPFAGPGDKFEVPLQVLNNIEGSDKESIALQLENSEHFKLLSDEKVNYEIAHKKDKNHTYMLEAKDILGDSWLSFSASSGLFSNKIRESMSVRPTAPYYSTYKIGSLQDENVEIPIKREIYPHLAKRTLTVGATPLIYQNVLQHFLSKFPHGCSEQLISKAIPYLILGDKKGYGFDKVSSADYLKKTLDMIRSRQNSNGSVALYPGSYVIRDFIGLYTYHFLLLAKEKGYPIDQRMFRISSQFIKKRLMKSTSLYEKAYGIYLLTLAEEVTTPFLMSIENDIGPILERISGNKSKWGDELALAYVAASYKLLQDDKKADDLIEGIELSKKEDLEDYAYYNHSLKDARLIDLFSRHFPKKAEKITGKNLITYFRDLERNLNTLSVSYTMMALDSYENYFKNTAKKDFEIWEYIEDSGSKDLKKQKVNLDTKTKSVYLYSSNAKKIEIKNPNDSWLFYAFSLTGFDRGKARPMSEGIEVFKKILNKEGAEVNSVTQGEEVVVEVSFRSKTGKAMRDIAIVDLYPSGFAPILTDQGKARGEAGFKPDFVDTREDRVILYGGATSDLQKVVYKLKATNVGEFTLPATLVEDMYHRENRAVGEQKKLVVKRKEK